MYRNSGSRVRLPTKLTRLKLAMIDFLPAKRPAMAAASPGDFV
jgi:hypothetical protein